MFLYIILAIPVLFCFYVKWVQSHWKRKGVEYIEPKFFHGNIDDSFETAMPVHRHILYRNFYNEFKRRGVKFGGIYNRLTPVLVPMDLELVKCILQSDFANFVNRGQYINEEGDPLSNHLFNLPSEKWKNLRSKLTPTFTSGKTKMMFATVVETTAGLETLLDKIIATEGPVDMKDVFCRYAIDVLSSVSFGTQAKCMEDETSPFLRIGKLIFVPDRSNYAQVKRAIAELLPSWIIERLKIRITKLEIEEFFMKWVKKIVDYREKNNICAQDFLHLLIQLKNNDELSDDSKINGKSDKQFLTMEQLTAQCYVFFLAGYETSASTMTFALMNMALYPETQEKAREEVNRIMKKYDDQITYDGIMEMMYLDQVLHETIRKDGVVSVFRRICNEDFKVPGSDFVIEKGTVIRIPLTGITRDPEYFPEPEKFDPERFSPENKINIPPFAHLPFGEGPRNCIGMRFGKLQTKVGIAFVLHKYKITLSKKTQIPMQIDPTKVFPTVIGGVWLNLEKIK
ncbi:unnamed protein product [Phyllotreta striolata]|uniref:Cytochrome P450 monooxygenase n=1 Tax=Phyllotreta striolata TaxID=444603 RepID=A0A9N9XPI0_PHYSR|nr:unnamed protein product [Phyllotreta striolata]